MLNQARVRPEAGVLPSVCSRGLVVEPHGVFHNEECNSRDIPCCPCRSHDTQPIRR